MEMEGLWANWLLQHHKRPLLKTQRGALATQPPVQLGDVLTIALATPALVCVDVDASAGVSCVETAAHTKAVWSMMPAVLKVTLKHAYDAMPL